MFLLVDSRHDPTADDMQMIEFLHYHIIPFTVVLTKADKLSKMKLKEHVKAIAADLYLGTENLLATSAQTGYGKDSVLLKIAEVTERTLSASGGGRTRERGLFRIDDKGGGFARVRGIGKGNFQWMNF